MSSASREAAEMDPGPSDQGLADRERRHREECYTELPPIRGVCANCEHDGYVFTLARLCVSCFVKDLLAPTSGEKAAT